MSSRSWSAAPRVVAAVCAVVGLCWTLGASAQDAKAPENDPKAVALINKYLESAGGKDNLTTIKDKATKFVNKKFSPTGVTEMRMARFLKRDLKIREEWELPGMGGLTKNGEPLIFVQVYDGEKGWVKTMGYVSELTGKTLTVFVWDKHLDDFFLHWEEDGYTVRHLPTTEISGKVAEGVETIAFAGGQKVRYYFGVEDGLLLKKEWTEPTGAGITKKEVFYSDYQKVRFRSNREQWIRMATNEKVFEDGELSLEKVFSEITINGGLEDKIFARPDGPSFADRPQAQPAGSQPASKPGTQPTSKPKTGATSKPKK